MAPARTVDEGDEEDEVVEVDERRHGSYRRGRAEVNRHHRQPSRWSTIADRRQPILILAVLGVAALLFVIRSDPTTHGAGRPGTADPTPGRRLTATTVPAATTTTTTWLPAATGAGYLVAGSDPTVLPGPIMIADKANNRLLIVDPQGRIRWQFPEPGDLAPGQTFLIPDDAFFSPDGREIIATQEDDFVISVIDIASRKIVWRYGEPGVAGAGPDRLWNPDDAMLLPDGEILSADIKNCRIVLIPPGGHSIGTQYGMTGRCTHRPPSAFGSPNGVFPMTDGHYLVTEINNDWVDELGLDGTVSWAAHPPGVRYPSDSNEIGPDRYLTVDYSSPGQVVVFNAAGQALWRFAPKGPQALDHPSLALPLPNGDILLNDDYNDRVIVVDPQTDQIVWQYGHTKMAAPQPGYLNIPDGVDLVPPYSLLGTHASTMGQHQ